MTRETFDTAGLRNYLDGTPAGMIKIAAHGSRPAAIAAMAEDERAALSWRRERAVELYTRHPDRYLSAAEAMGDVGEPPGYGGTWLSGTSEDIAKKTRWSSIGRGVKNLGDELPDGRDSTVLDGRTGQPADTRPGWGRD